jgi:hypothetical protein
MRGKDFNTGLRGVLFEARHYERMGSAVWLYAWLVLRQTHQTGEVGWVLGGAPVSYREIEEETGFNVRTLERWMSTLRRYGYIQTQSSMGGLIVRITKAKKHTQARNSAEPGGIGALRRAAGGLRKVANEVRKSAEGDTQKCVGVSAEIAANTQLPPRISSSSVEEFLERNRTHDQNHNQFQLQDQSPTQNPGCSGESQNQTTNRTTNPVGQSTRDLFSEPVRNRQVSAQEPRQTWIAIAGARLQQQLLRAERDEAVRRELRVGAGPDTRTSARSVEAERAEVKSR